MAVVGFAVKVRYTIVKIAWIKSSAGRYNLCEDVQFAGVYPHAGTLQRFKCHPARWLHK